MDHRAESSLQPVCTTDAPLLAEAYPSPHTARSTSARVMSNTRRRMNRRARYADNLVLPDPYVTERPRGRDSESRPPHATIDLTTSPTPPPPTPLLHTHRPEVIDLDAMPDPNPPRDTHTWRPSPERDQRDSYDPEELWGLQSPGPFLLPGPAPTTAYDAQRARRRQWLFQTAQERTRQRQRRAESHTEPAHALNTPLTNIQEFIGSNINMNQFRAFVHGPNGGGPINQLMQLPERFLTDSNISLIRRNLDGRHARHGLAEFWPTAWESPDRRSPALKYVPPEPVKEPFTRTFTDKDNLVCPGCEAELGMGDDVKRKIFVSKCSHVYCGDCGTGIKTAAKNKGIVCKAHECNKKITRTRIFEAFV